MKSNSNELPISVPPLSFGRSIKSFESAHLSLATELSVTGSFYIASSMVQ